MKPETLKGKFDQEWLNIAVKFDLGECLIQKRPVYIKARKQRDGSVLWSVSMHEWVLSKSGKWYYEPMPSSRTDHFIKMTRFPSKEDAFEAYFKFVKKKEEHVLTYGVSKEKSEAVN